MMMSLLPIMLAGSLQVTLPPVPPAGVPPPARSWFEDPPSSRIKRVVQNTSRRFLLPTLEVGICNIPAVASGMIYPAINTVLLRIPAIQPARQIFFTVLSWHEPSYRQWVSNMTALPVFPDHDNLIFNFGIHPWVGATTHLLYRNHGVSFVQSVVIVLMWSVFWEYFAEASSERPSLNDIMANTTGAVFGEALFRAKTLLKQQMPPGVPRTVLLTLIDPFGTMEGVVLDVAEHNLGLHSVVTYLR